MLRNAKYLEIARAIFDARETVEANTRDAVEAQRIAAASLARLEESQRVLAALEAQFDAGFGGDESDETEVGEPTSSGTGASDVPSEPDAPVEPPREAESFAVVGVLPDSPRGAPKYIPPWKVTSYSKSKRVHSLLVAFPKREFTAKEIEEETGVPAKNVNQILSRGYAETKPPIYDRPRPGVYTLAQHDQDPADRMDTIISILGGGNSAA
jgi:hypothetical protein